VIRAAAALFVLAAAACSVNNPDSRGGASPCSHPVRESEAGATECVARRTCTTRPDMVIRCIEATGKCTCNRPDGEVVAFESGTSCLGMVESDDACEDDP